MKSGLLPSLVALLLLGACRSREPRFPVEDVVLKGATAVDNGLLGWSAAEIQGRFLGVLRDSHHFELRDSDAAPDKAQTPDNAPGPWSFTLELPFTREALKDGSAYSFAEVGVTLVMEREAGGDAERDTQRDTQRYQVVGLGEVRVEARDAETRRKALREALLRGLTQVADAARLQLLAAERPDAALTMDLRSPDERVREFALRVLAERRNPAAAPLLIRQLQDGDLQVARRAMGALVEMKERSAVPALIELVKDRNLGFMQEVVFAIGEIGGAEAEAYLFTVAQGHDQPDVQSAAQQALDTLAAAHKLATPEARGPDRAEH